MGLHPIGRAAEKALEEAVVPCSGQWRRIYKATDGSLPAKVPKMDDKALYMEKMDRPFHQKTRSQ